MPKWGAFILYKQRGSYYYENFKNIIENKGLAYKPIKLHFHKTYWFIVTLQYCDIKVSWTCLMIIFRSCINKLRCGFTVNETSRT